MHLRRCNMKKFPGPLDIFQAKSRREKTSVQAILYLQAEMLATLKPTHLRNESDRLVIHAHLFSSNGFQQNRQVAILSFVAIIGDVLPNVFMLEAEDAHCDLIHRIFKLERKQT